MVNKSQIALLKEALKAPKSILSQAMHAKPELFGKIPLTGSFGRGGTGAAASLGFKTLKKRGWF